MARAIPKEKIMRREAFTVIELLVVIVILAILASILFPVFASAKTASRKTASIQNLKQIFAASTLYSGDYDQRVPYAVDECNFRGLCQSLYISDLRAKILGNHIPSFTQALKPYGVVADHFRIPVGLGEQDFQSMGSNYFYGSTLSSAPLQPLEEGTCPYFNERKTYFWDGGVEREKKPSDRLLVLYFSGQVRYASYSDVFDEIEACRSLTRDGSR